MENVLSKKVRQTLAGALAFVLALTSLPFTAQTVKAEEATAAGIKIGTNVTSTWSSAEVDNPVSTINLVKGGSATAIGVSSGVNPDVQDWVSSKPGIVSSSPISNNSATVITGLTKGSAVLTYTASSGTNNTDKASARSAADVYVYDIVTGTATSDERRSSVEIISGEAGAPTIDYYFSNGAAEMTGTTTWESSNTGSASFSGKTLTPKGSGTVIVTGTNSGFSGTQSASASLEIIDRKATLTVKDGENHTLTSFFMASGDTLDVVVNAEGTIPSDTKVTATGVATAGPTDVTNGSAALNITPTGNGNVVFTASGSVNETPATLGSASVTVASYAIGVGDGSVGDSTSNVDIIAGYAVEGAEDVAPVSNSVSYYFGTNNKDSRTANVDWSNDGTSSQGSATENEGIYTYTASAVGDGSVTISASGTTGFYGNNPKVNNNLKITDKSVPVGFSEPSIALAKGNSKTVIVKATSNSDVVTSITADSVEGLAIVGPTGLSNGSASFQVTATKDVPATGLKVPFTFTGNITNHSGITVGRGVLTVTNKALTGDIPKFEVTGTKVIDVYNASADGLDVAISENTAETINAGSAVPGKTIEAEDILNKKAPKAGLYLIQGTDRWEVSYSSAGTTVDATSKFGAAGMGGHGGGTPKYIGDAEPGLYTFTATYDVAEVIKDGNNFKVETIFSSAASAYYTAELIQLLDNEGNPLERDGGEPDAYTITVGVDSKTAKKVELTGLASENQSGGSFTWTSGDTTLVKVDGSKTKATITGVSVKDSGYTNVQLLYKSKDGTFGYTENIHVIVNDDTVSLSLKDSSNQKVTVSEVDMTPGKSAVYTIVPSKTSGKGQLQYMSVVSSASAVAEVSEVGSDYSFTVKAIAPGTTQLTIQSKEGDKVYGSTTLKIKVTNETITLNPTVLYLRAGGDIATINATTSKSGNVIWNSSGDPVIFDAEQGKVWNEKTEEYDLTNDVEITTWKEAGEATLGVNLYGVTPDPDKDAAEAKITVFGLDGTNSKRTNGNFSVENLVINESTKKVEPGHYEANLYYVKTKDEEATETLDLKVMYGDTASLNWKDNAKILTVSNSNDDIATFKEGTITPTGKEFGTTTFTIVFNNTEKTKSSAAKVTLKLDVTVTNYSFTFDTMDSKVYGQDKTFTVTPVQSWADDNVQKLVTDGAKYVDLTFSLKDPVTFSSGGDLDHASANTSTGLIWTGSAIASESDPYIVTITAKAKEDAHPAYNLIKNKVLATQTFKFSVVSGNIALKAPTEPYFFYANGGVQNITVVRDSDNNDNGASVAIATSIARSSANAEVKISGNTITVTPKVNTPESFKIYVGDPGDAEVNAGNCLIAYDVEILGVTAPKYDKKTTFTYPIYITDATSDPTGEIVLGPTIADLSTAVSGYGMLFKNLDNFVTWKSSNEDVVEVARKITATPGADGTTYLVGALTAHKAGTATVTATLSVYDSGDTSGTGTPKFSRSFNFNVTVTDLSGITFTESSVETISLDLSQETTLEPKLSKDIDGVKIKFKLSEDNNNAIRLIDNAAKQLSPYEYTGGTTLDITASSAIAGTTASAKILVTAYVEGENGAKDVDVTSAEVTVNVSDTKSTAVIKAKTTNAYGMVDNNEIYAATNLIGTTAAGTIKNDKITLADLTGDNGIYTFEDGWDWSEPTMDISTAGLPGDTITVPVTYSVEGSTLKSTANVRIHLLGVKGLYATVTNGNPSSPSDNVSINTSDAKVSVTALEFVSATDEKDTYDGFSALDGNSTEFDAFIKYYLGAYSISSASDLFTVAKKSGSSVSLDNITYAANTNAFDIAAVSGTYGKSVVTASALGFTATINVENVKVLSVITVNNLGAATPATGDYAGAYYVKSGDVSELTASISATNVKKISLKSSNTSVATIDKTAEGEATFAPKITIKGTGYTKLTITADDTVKTTKDVELYVVSAAAGVQSMQLDPGMTYDKTTSANEVGLFFTGAGYGLKGQTLTITKQEPAAIFNETVGYKTVKYYESVDDNEVPTTKLVEETIPFLTLKNKNASPGKYTVTFSLTAQNLLNPISANDVPIKDVTMTVNIQAVKFTASSFSVKQTGTANFFFAYHDGVEDSYAQLKFDCKVAEIEKIAFTSSYYEFVDGVKNVTTGASTLYLDSGGVANIRMKASVKDEAAVKEAVKGANRKLTFTITPKGYDTSYTKTVTIKGSFKAPKFTPTVKSATIYKNFSDSLGTSFDTIVSYPYDGETYNVYGLNKSNGFTVGLIKNDKTAAELFKGVATDAFTVSIGADGNDHIYTITANTKYCGTGTIKAALTFKDENQRRWQAANYVVKVPITIKVDDKAKAVNLVTSTKTITLNSGAEFLGKEAAYVKVDIKGETAMNKAVAKKLTFTGANSKSQAIASSLQAEIYDFNAKDVIKKADLEKVDAADKTTYATWGYKITMPKAVAKGTYKFVIGNSGMSAKTATLTIKVEPNAPTVTQKTKGSIDIMDDTKFITLTPSFKGISVKDWSVKIVGTNQSKFNPTNFKTTKNVTTFELHPYWDNNWSIRQKYTVDLEYTLTLDSGKTITLKPTKPLSFKVKNSKMTAAMTPSVPNISVGGERTVKGFAYYTLNKKSERNMVAVDSDNLAKIVQTSNKDKVKIDPMGVISVKTVDDGDPSDSDWGAGVIKVTPLNAKPGKTISVKLQVYQIGQAIDAKPATVTLKVKIPK